MISYKINEGNDTWVYWLGSSPVPIDIPETVVFVEEENYDIYFSPWPSKNVFPKSPDFEGKADVFFNQLITSVIPEAEQGKEVNKRILVGYSLAGLSALYFGTKTDLFSSIASVSGSLWYPDFVEYISQHPLQCANVYFSLGDSESKSKNPMLATVEANTLLVKDLVSSYTNCIYQSNSGGHFNSIDERVLKAINWCSKALK